MKYILLIYNAESAWDGQTQEQQNAEYAEYSNLSSGLREKEQLVLSEALHPIAQATSVRTREGKTMITDGPFAETKEQLGGFYLIDVKDLDEAIEVAKKIPSVRYGTIEIRPLVVFE
ncbi:MAG: YciI family protein [Anaerolineae bacterium]|nr:YciI family protein [Anaerolineae bacterium]